MLHFLKRVSIVVLLLLLIIAATIVFILGTSSGNQWLLHQISQRTSTKIQTISGTLLQTLSLRGLEFQSEHLNISLEQLDIEWQPSSLLYGVINIKRIRAENLVFFLPVSEPHSKSSLINLPEIKLPFFVRLQQIQFQNLLIEHGSDSALIDALDISASMIGSRLSLKNFLVKSKYGQVQVRGKVGTQAPFILDLELDWDVTFKDLKGRGRLSGNLEQIYLEQDITSPLKLHISGNISSGLLAQRNSPYAKISVSWDTLILPIERNYFDAELKKGVMHLDGWLDLYHLKMETAIQQSALPDIDIAVHLDAEGNRSGLQFTPLRIYALDGLLESKGTIQWFPEFNWDLQLEAGGLNPGTFLSEWPGKLSLSALTKGHANNSTFSGDFHLKSLGGNLRNYPLSASTDLSFSQQGWWCNNMKLAIGQNNFTLKGGVKDQLYLDWKINARQLAALWPGLTGELDAQGLFLKNKNQITTKGQLHATALRYGDYSLDALNASVNSDGRRHHIFTHLEAFTFKNITANRISLDLNGKTEQHTIKFEIDSPEIIASASVQGEYKAPTWKAMLTKIDLTAKRHALWTLTKPSMLSISSQHYNIDQICLASNDSRFCVDARWNQDKGLILHSKITDLPLALLNPYLHHNSNIEGLLNGDFDLQGSMEKINANAYLYAERGNILLNREDNTDFTKTEHYPWRALSIKAKLRDQRWQVDAGIDFIDQGALSTKLDINNQSYQLNGQVNAVLNDIGLAEIFLPFARDISGAFDLQCALSGSLTKPHFSVNGQIKNASLFLPELGIKAQQVSLRLNSQNRDRINIQGSAISGSGQLEVGGSINLDDIKHWQLLLDVKGQDFLLLDLPNIYSTVSPDIKITANPNLLSLDGVLLLPEVNIKAKGLAHAAVHSSKDAIIIDADENHHSDAGQLPIKTRVKLILGNKVHFDGFGFETRLAGTLDLKEDPGQATLAYGELFVAEGYYRGYGQKLKIEQGTLLFQGPYDNPAVDVLIRRTAENVSASLEISGTLRTLRSRIYSVPSLPDGEAIAILLTGKALDSASQTDASFLVETIASLGLEKGQSVSDKIAKTFKLDTLTINSESDLMQSSLLIGKYLTPRLYIRYAMGLFDQISNVSLDYQLSKLLKLEAKSGKDRSVDLIYKIEK